MTLSSTATMRPHGILSRFRRDRRGIAAIEFALILPIMAILYLGGFEITEGVTLNRKVTHAASTLGDLVAQTRAVGDAEMENIFNAVEAIMVPYPTDDMTMVISGVSIDDDGDLHLEWSDARNTTEITDVSQLNVPDSVIVEDTFLVVAEVHYPYTPVFGAVLTGTFDLTDTFYLRPRLKDEVCRPTC